MDSVKMLCHDLPMEQRGCVLPLLFILLRGKSYMVFLFFARQVVTTHPLENTLLLKCCMVNCSMKRIKAKFAVVRVWVKLKTAPFECVSFCSLLSVLTKLFSFVLLFSLFFLFPPWEVQVQCFIEQ